MKWVKASERNPNKFGKYYIRTHCGTDFYHWNNPLSYLKDLEPYWYKDSESNSSSHVCHHCTNFEWLDEDEQNKE